MRKKVGLMLAVFVLVAAGMARADEPAYYEYYREMAVTAADAVTSATDSIKAFRSSPRYADLPTSTAVQDEYTTRINALQDTLNAVRDGLLTTATAVLDGARNELDAAKRLMKYQ